LEQGGSLIPKNKTEDIEEFISEEIKKSGFPLEAYANMILDKKGWDINPHLLYYNESEQCYNEIDIVAIKSSLRKGFKGGKFLKREILIIECKKQEKKPWIFFEGDEEIVDSSSLCVVPPNLNLVSKQSFKNHYYFKQKPCNYHFPTFVKSGKPDVIFDTINHLIESIDSYKKTTLDLKKKITFQGYDIYYPVIILDGKLFSAKIEIDGKIKVSEVNYLQLEVSRLRKEAELLGISNVQITWSNTKDYVIDVVRKGFFEEFLKNFP